MAKKTKKADLNIYLAKPEVETVSEVLKKTGQLKCFDLKASCTSSCALYIKKSHHNPPAWVNFFEPEVDISEFGKNSSTGTVLLVKVNRSIFILSFGHDHHLIDSSVVEMNFGLKVVLNILDEESIRSIDKSSFEQHPTQSREQTGIATELQYFGVDVERDPRRCQTQSPHPRTVALNCAYCGNASIASRMTPKPSQWPLKQIFHRGPFSLVAKSKIYYSKLRNPRRGGCFATSS